MGDSNIKPNAHHGIFQKFQNKMFFFSLLHYTSKNEKIDHECCTKRFKKNHGKLVIKKLNNFFKKIPKGSSHIRGPYIKMSF